MKDRLIKTKDWSEQLADAAFGFRLYLLIAIKRPDAERDLKEGLVSFDQVFDLWKAEMDEGVGNALEIASPALFEGVDSITRDYIQGLVVAIRSSIISVFPEELLLSINATLGAPAKLSWLWSTAKKNGVASPMLIAEEMKVACKIAGDKEKRKRMRIEFNAAIRRETQPKIIDNKTPKKKTTSEVMMEIVWENPEALAWSLGEWVRETKIKKSTINSCKAYCSKAMKRSREMRKAIGIEDFQKNASLLDGEKRKEE